MSERISTVLIVGGGTAGWMSACILSRRCPDLDITLIESSDIPTVGVGEATIIHMTDFLKEMNLKETDWMTGCNATYKEGICFRNFYEPGKHYWHPFQSINLQATDYWLQKHYTEGCGIDSYFDYCYSNTVRNTRNRINLENKINFDEIRSINYTYHLDAGLFAQFLKQNIARPAGVRHVVDDVTEVELDETGFVDHVRTRGHGELRADLYIDCSGFRSLLLGKTLGEPFEDYLQKVPNDRAIAVRVPYEDKDAELRPYTSATALSAGWVWNIPLWHRLGTGYVFSSHYLSPEDAEAELRRHLGEERVRNLDFHHIRMRIGRFRDTWRNNVAAIGLAAGFIEPLESTGIELAQLGAEELAQYLRTRPSNAFVNRRLYNEKMRIVYNEIVDYIQLHYILTNREDTPYWRDQKYGERPLSDELLGKLARREGSFARDESGHVFSNTAWNCILIGMRRLPPKENLPAPDPATLADASRQLEANHRRALEQAQAGPTHREYLAEHIYAGQE